MPAIKQSLAVGYKIDGNTPDDRLIQSAMAGDQDAYTELYRRYLNVVRAACKSVIRSELQEEVDDVTQEVFQVVFAKSLAKFKAQSALSTFLWGVARLHTLDYNRRTRHRRLISTDHIPKISVSEALRVRAGEDNDADGIIARLEQRHWIPVLLWCFEEWPKNRVGQALGWREKYAYQRMTEAEEALKDALTRAPLSESSPSVQKLKLVKKDLPALMRLCPSSRFPYIMRRFESASYKEIAKRLRYKPSRRLGPILRRAKILLATARKLESEPQPPGNKEIRRWVRAMKARRNTKKKSVSILQFLNCVDRMFLEQLIQRYGLKAPKMFNPLYFYFHSRPYRRPSLRQLAKKLAIPDKRLWRYMDYGGQRLIRELIILHLAGKSIPGLSKREFEDLISRLDVDLSRALRKKGLAVE